MAMMTKEDQELLGSRTIAERLVKQINGKYAAGMAKDFEKLEAIRSRIAELGGDPNEAFQKLLVVRK